MSYPAFRRKRAKEGRRIPPLDSPDVESRKSPVAGLSLRLFKWRDDEQPSEDWVDNDEGYETDYDYAPAVVSRYRGHLLPSDDYVEVFETIEEKGIAALTKTNGSSGSHSSRRGIGRKLAKGRVKHESA